MTQAEVEQLGTHGWFLREGFPAALEASRDALQRHAAGEFKPAAISREHRHDASIRTDSLLWLEAGPLFTAFEALRLELNAGAWLNLQRFDLQLAHYAVGGHYSRHLDALAGRSNRKVTAIVYLNPGWTPADGGQLRLYSAPPVDLEPVLGRTVIFRSEKLEHEVLPSQATRLAATAWYYGR